ncbi:hypothetical protein [Kaarinaea lacus]
MMGIMIETVVMAFVVGGVVGAITALQLSNNSRQIPVKIRHNQSRDSSQHKRRMR